MIRRPKIPDPVRREVRQRCGFGCVFCGHPVYEIDHLVGWSETADHTPGNLTLLCPNHHAEKTKGLLPQEQVVEANANPVNVQRRHTAPYSLPYAQHGERCVIRLGGNTFGTEFAQEDDVVHALVIDNTPVLSFLLIDGGLYLRLLLVDECNRILVIVEENEIIQATAGWDFESVANRLVVRSGPGDIALEVEFETPSSIYLTRGTLRLNGVEVQIRNGGLIIPGYQDIYMSGNTGRNGLILGHQDQIIMPSPVPITQGFAGFSDIPRRSMPGEAGF